MKKITVLIPTYNRPTALAATLSSLLAQSWKDFDIVISDQSDTFIEADPTITTLRRIFQLHQIDLTLLHHLPRAGMADQRHFLLQHAETPYVLYLDDDLILEPYVIRNLMQTIGEEQCGFVGMPAIGLSYQHDYRPEEERVSFWEGQVQPEDVVVGSPEWQRYRLHNAANSLHVAQQLGLSPHTPKPYKVAWVGGCVLYHTNKLIASGGFGFMDTLPADHCGEDVMAQLNVMSRYGGCAILPSGVYHQELPTTVKTRTINAPEYLTKPYHEL